MRNMFEQRVSKWLSKPFPRMLLDREMKEREREKEFNCALYSLMKCLKSSYIHIHRMYINAQAGEFYL